PGPVDDFLDGLGEAAGLAGLAVEAAEFAGVPTDIAVMKVAVDNVGGVVAVQPFARLVGGPAQSGDVRGFEEAKAVLGAESFALCRLVDDVRDVTARKQLVHGLSLATARACSSRWSLRVP